MKTPFLAKTAQNPLFLSTPDSKLSTELEIMLELFENFPEIEKSIIDDQDSHAKKKKAIRLQDKRWELNKQEERYTGNIFPATDQAIDESSLELAEGRPRMLPVLVYVFMWMRGLLGGSPKNQAVQTMLLESRTIEVLLRNCGASLPGSSTIIDNVNLISEETLKIITQSQLEQIKRDGLDDFEECTMDSTSSKGNSERPSESTLIARLVERIYHCGSELNHFNIANMHERNFPKIIKDLNKLAKEIALDCGRNGAVSRRKSSYNKMISKAESAMRKFEAEMVKIESRVAEIDLMPSQMMMLQEVVSFINDDISNLQRVMDSARERVLKGNDVKSCDKVLSLSDPDVACIVKGQRDTVFGFKPQLARTKNGFVSALILPKGNAADSGQLDGVIHKHIENTGVTPKLVSTDDGYANKTIREKWLKNGVETFSISGSKGKKITPEEDWNSEIYRSARNNRSAVESLMFCVKFCYNFGRNVRRGLKAVRQEMMEKVIAYNFARMVKVRQAKLLPA